MNRFQFVADHQRRTGEAALRHFRSLPAELLLLASHRSRKGSPADRLRIELVIYAKAELAG
ncbi:hypothetical protein ACFW9I_35090 [[Kitasatospora] papulosa]|uniref:hypothetical protein n=1 Tax=[Kitasatospora] papulosa TaxID=1464011 RepID=UPI0036B2FB50